MYEEGDRVLITAWEIDLERTAVLQGTVVEVGDDNTVVVELDTGETRQFRFDEVEKI